MYREQRYSTIYGSIVYTRVSRELRIAGPDVSFPDHWLLQNSNVSLICAVKIRRKGYTLLRASNVDSLPSPFNLENFIFAWISRCYEIPRSRNHCGITQDVTGILKSTYDPYSSIHQIKSPPRQFSHSAMYYLHFLHQQRQPL